MRNLISLSHDIAKEAYDDSQDISEILDTVERSIFAITNNRMQKGFTQINNVVVDALEKLEIIRASGGSVIGVPSGLIDLDEMTSDFKKVI